MKWNSMRPCSSRLLKFVLTLLLLCCAMLAMYVNNIELPWSGIKVAQSVRETQFGTPPEPGIPMEHPEEVALRIIVIAFNRNESLLKCLTAIKDLVTDGDEVILDIFLDKGKGNNGQNHNATVATAMKFEWPHGQVRVHLQKKHVGIYGQWIDSWRPRKGTREVALIVEDDLTLSKYFWKWLKAAHRHYAQRSDVQGFSLRGNAIYLGPRSGRWVNVKKVGSAFLYKLFGTHAFSPVPSFWREFQDWYHENIRNTSFRPYTGMPPVTPVHWYKHAVKQDTMWEMWCLYFSWLQKKFTVYPNIGPLVKQNQGELCLHRAEVGLHSRRAEKINTNLLLHQWDDKYIQFPNDTVKLDWTGDIISSYIMSKVEH